MASSKIATAYVQVMPSMEGVAPKVKSFFGSAGSSSGSLFGANFGSMIKNALVSAGIGTAIKETILEGADLEQLKGGAQKIFDEIDTSAIVADAANAYKDLNMSANEYLATINDVGATFAATMGDEKGYSVARTGLQAISDYASGTGKSVDVLSEKFTMITRSTSSYQSIADQFSGILPATSADFLKQAQAAGLLSGKYQKLTEVPVAEYQEVVAEMLKKGTAELGLAGNTAAETATTLTGSFNAMKAAFSNVLGNLTLGTDIKPSLVALADTTKTFLVGNLVPAVTNIITALPGACTTFLDALIPENVNEVVSSTITNFTAYVTENLPKVLETGSTTLATFMSGIAKLIPNLAFSASEIIRTLSDYIINDPGKLFASAGELFASIVSGLAELLPTLATSAVDIIISLGGYLVENAGAILEYTLELGSVIAKGIWEGLVGMWNSIADIPGLVSGIVGNFGNVGSDLPIGITRSNFTFQSHAKGLDYVPYDGYLAELHKGEMVLTSKQADAVRGGNLPGRNVVVNQYIYSEAKTSADLMREARYQQELAVMMNV